MSHSDQISRWNSLANKLLIVLWLCFIVRGCFYCALLPVWEGYDEPSHFAFIQYVIEHRGLPVVTTPVSREVQASLHLMPLSWEQRLHELESPIYTEDSYWQLPEGDRNELREKLRSIPPAWQSQAGTAPAMYEAQQAPLYYWIMSVPMRLAASWGLPARVLLIRILSVLLASLLVPIAYVTANEVFLSRAQALAIAAVITCMPELMIDISRAGNESLAIVVFSLFTLSLLRAAQPGKSMWFLIAGIVLGIGLLSKAYFLVAIPAYAVVALHCAWHDERKRILLRATAGLCVAAIISFGWYWRNHALTGSWSGEINDVAASHRGVAHLIAAIPHVNWIGGVTSVLVSHIWFGAWSFLKLPKPVYLIFLLGIVAIVIGVAKAIAKDRFRSSALFVAFAIYGFFWLGLLYDVLITYISSGSSSSTGWYLYAVVLPEILLIAWAVNSLVPAHLRWAVLPAIATLFAAIDLYGVHFLLAPYYTGMIAHVAGSEVVHPARLSATAECRAGIHSRSAYHQPA